LYATNEDTDQNKKKEGQEEEQEMVQETNEDTVCGNMIG